jgi:hypothetical protein
MTTLAIFDELVNSGFETNVLKTRENIIIQLACNHIKSRVLYIKEQLVDIYSNIKSHEKNHRVHVSEANTHRGTDVGFHFKIGAAAISGQIGGEAVKVHGLLNKFKTLESEFPSNILSWTYIRGIYNTETICPTAKLLLPDEFVDKMKQFDIKYNNFKKEYDVIYRKYLCVGKHNLPRLYDNFDTKLNEINNVLAKSLELDFDT